MATRTTAINFFDANLIVSALKSWELKEGETDESRLLIGRFRQMRSELQPPLAADTPEVQAEIFSAGLDESGRERN